MQTIKSKGFFSKISLFEVAEKLKKRELSVQELIQHTLESIDNLDSKLNAFCHIDKNYALKQAQDIDKLFDKGIILSQLQGIPIAIKDNIDTKHLITTMGSAFYKDNLPKDDAECVKLLKSAGAIIIGKTNTHEFAYGPTGDCSLHGPTRNPWNIYKISGGSSCGSAVAVAAGLVPIAIGTDTGGSIRIPASLTGIIGIKPSFGRLSTSGVFPLSQSLDHLGILAKNIDEIKIVFNLLNQLLPSKNNQENVSKSTPKIGWIPLEQVIKNWDKHQSNTIKEQAFELLKKIGIEEVDKNLKKIFSELNLCFSVIQNAEAYNIHKDAVETQADLFQIEVLERLKNAKHTTGYEYVQALSLCKKLYNDFADIFQQYDFLVMPTVPITVPNIHQRYIYLNNVQVNIKSALLSLTSPWNVLGFPACSIPLALLDNMPLGLQIIANKNQDIELMELISNLSIPHLDKLNE